MGFISDILSGLAGLWITIKGVETVTKNIDTPDIGYDDEDE
jgi:hypothetical protein